MPAPAGSVSASAARVSRSRAPCLRRVKRLEADGVIVGYTALLDPVAMGHAFEVLVSVDLTHKDRDTVERFEAEIAALDEVIEVRRMFGLPDYVVRVGTPDLESFEAFVTARLGAVSGIAKVDSHLTMKVVKSPDRPERSRTVGPRRRTQ
jgi:DNA-binding Lrp family transcriptional regulator